MNVFSMANVAVSYFIPNIAVKIIALFMSYPIKGFLFCLLATSFLCTFCGKKSLIRPQKNSWTSIIRTT